MLLLRNSYTSLFLSFSPSASTLCQGIILARMGAKALLPSDPAGVRASTNAFFVFSNGLVLASVVLWLTLLRDPSVGTLPRFTTF